MELQAHRSCKLGFLDLKLRRNTVQGLQTLLPSWATFHSTDLVSSARRCLELSATVFATELFCTEQCAALPVRTPRRRAARPHAPWPSATR